MNHNAHFVSEFDKQNTPIHAVPGYDPRTHTLMHGLLVGPPNFPFGSTNAKVNYTQHFFKLFSLVVPACLVPVPSSNTIDLAQVQTLPPEIAETAEDEAALRRFMAGKSPEVCERQFEYGSLHVVKNHLEQRLPGLTNPKAIEHITAHIAFLEREMQQWKEGAIWQLTGRPQSRGRPPSFE